MFLECVEVYRKAGHMLKVASIQEEIATYYLHSGRFSEAEETCWAALDLIDDLEDTISRGRLYRQLGRIAEAREDLRHAYVFFRVSHDLLRRVGSSREADASLLEFQRVRSLLVGDPCRAGEAPQAPV